VSALKDSYQQSEFLVVTQGGHLGKGGGFALFFQAVRNRMVPFSGGTLNSQTKTLNFVVAGVIVAQTSKSAVSQISKSAERD